MKGGRNIAVTRKEVAQHAGVSVAVVSRVINGVGYVSQEKREAVEKTIAELGYRPNPIARSLKGNKSRQLLYYVRDLSNYFYYSIYRGMTEAAQKFGYSVIISGPIGFEEISSLMVDGVILPNEYYLDKYHAQKPELPFVLISYSPNRIEGVRQICVDTSAAARVAINHLIDEGHRRIAFVTCLERGSKQSRGAVYREMLTPILGGEIDNYVIAANQHIKDTYEEINYFEVGRKAAAILAERGLDVTAAFCFNDDIAVGFCSGLGGLGINTPHDISIIGIDGSFIGQYTNPPISTVSISPFEQGYKAVEMLIDTLENDAKPSVHKVDITLISRESVKPIISCK